jgi:SAM-dependent methyltransferase
MNEQETWWAGEAGNAYTARNRVDWRSRIPFWHDIMKFTGARSVYEVGCGAGWNLSAIREAADHYVKMEGNDVNDLARSQAIVAGIEAREHPAWKRMNVANCYELVFTAGCLIHVAPENLEFLMKQIIAASSHYVLAIEYESDESSAQPIAEQMIEYRGEKDRLWKRQYGKLYEAMRLKLLHTGDAVGFDKCAYWLFSKP